MVFICIQWIFAPFISREANTAELILLTCLPVINMAHISVIQHFAPSVVSVVLSVMIVIPIPIVLLCVIRTVQRTLRNSEVSSPVPVVDIEGSLSDSNINETKRSSMSLEFANLGTVNYVQGATRTYSDSETDAETIGLKSTSNAV